MEGKPIPNLGQHPVTQITYDDAVAYAEWLGHRLPEEWEWEYSALAGEKDKLFPWGNDISPANANYGSDCTSEVMKYSPNDFGLFDMAGNVWEWTNSWYMAYPGNHQENSYFGEKYKVVRGGAWMYDGAHCMSSYRNANQPDRAYPTVGFRTVLNFKEN